AHWNQLLSSPIPCSKQLSSRYQRLRPAANAVGAEADLLAENNVSMCCRRAFLLHKNHTYHLTCRTNLAITIGSKRDQFGGVASWRKSDFKRVSPSRMRCAVSSAKCSRKILSRRLSVTPST